MLTDAQLRDEYERDPVWGPMSHAARDSVPDGSPPWKDHIYLAFWDVDADAWGYLHWNSSPNHDTTKAHLCLQHAGRRVDHREALGPSTTRFASESIDFDLSSTIRIAQERVTGELTVSPRFSAIDYDRGVTILPTIAGVEGSEVPEHFQQGLRIEGELSFDGEPVVFDGLGFRTRTWGHRDDSNQFTEYISLFACCATFDVTAMKFKHPDGSQRANGCLVKDTGEEVRVDDLHVTRDPRGLPLRVTLDLADGGELPVRWEHVHSEFWCPIGLPERTGPTFSAWDQWIELDVGGERAYGMSEQAIVRTVF